MSNLLSGLTTDETINTEKDTLGGGGGPLDSGLYKSTITLAFLNKSRGGALGLNLHCKTEEGREFRQTLWVTSGDAKGNKNFYENKQGEKNYLPGFLHADALCLLTVGKGLSEMHTETKVVNVYNPDAGAEVPTNVEALVDLHGEEVFIGLLKQIEDKNIKNDAGVYVPSGETRETNEIDKVFRAKDGMTTAEIRAQADEANFIHAWKEKWEGKVKDKSTKQGGNGGARQGAPAQSGGAAAAAGGQRKSLFA